MLREKIKRYQRQHAHNLALENSIDIAFKWQCSRKSPQPIRFLPADEIANVKIAVRLPDPFHPQPAALIPS